MWRMHRLLYKRRLHGQRNMGKRIKEWENACIECGMPPWKLKNLIKIIFASKFIMFEETLEFKQAIIICYGRQKTIILQQKLPKPTCGPLQR
jgi:hypothetical protein